MGSERALLNLGVERGRINRPGVFQDKRVPGQAGALGTARCSRCGPGPARDRPPGAVGGLRSGNPESEARRSRPAECDRRRPRFRVEAPAPNKIPALRRWAAKSGAGWSGADSNRRHTAFQAVALPPELPDLKTHTNVPVPAALVNDRSGCFIPPSTGIGRAGQRWTARDQSAPPNGARPTSVSSAGCGKSVGRGV